MVKDVRITSKEFLNFFFKHLQNEKSDSIFERQFDLASASISTYTPAKYREELNNEVFKFVIDLVGKIPPEQNNRIVILKSKIPLFAKSSENKKVLIQWR